ncbi:MAG: 23S rRNA (pseudouridine(1915)-N(3))-methyltransferase RlmH [Betaproteobacteria bacterium]|nr:23S rRNA (pseudouridine(1915)-N(3))-methyltransferase RlmH [Betaproteobacteria bacterium]MDH5220627.1 23S rRNA (pseudouridine(1915)-N(3))-methyltransferase RlmH [Betaproteobacteria bacterium]MDH5350545.1 23S rRNA (pseudouridine(1915)-N(3))-methyltransferase RlmH [Betaproteobacteria bacterium]
MARLLLVAQGARLRGWAAAARDEYLARMPRGYAVQCVDQVPRGARIVALDERGEALTSAQFASLLARWAGAQAATAFVVGGPDGLDTQTRKGAERLLRLSSLTLPHALAQVVLAEQLYRAATRLTGHPYHRE